MEEDGGPSIYDYLAASMLAIFTVWFWGQASIQFPQFFEAGPQSLVTATSYAVYTIGGTIVSYLVLEKSRSRRLIVGLKVGAFSFVASAIYFYMLGVVHVYLIFALLFSFLFGGYLGAVLYIKRTMGGVETPPADEYNPPGDTDDSEPENRPINT